MAEYNPWQVGYDAQMRWLRASCAGPRGLALARHALALRESSLGPDPFNKGGNQATRDYIGELEERTWGES
jgi:hypothetical protein